MLGESGFYFGNDDLFLLLYNCISDRTAARRDFLFCYRRRGQFMGELAHSVKSLATSLGRVADRESKYLS